MTLMQSKVENDSSRVVGEARGSEPAVTRGAPSSLAAMALTAADVMTSPDRRVKLSGAAYPAPSADRSSDVASWPSIDEMGSQLPLKRPDEEGLDVPRAEALSSDDVVVSAGTAFDGGIGSMEPLGVVISGLPEATEAGSGTQLYVRAGASRTDAMPESAPSMFGSLGFGSLFAVAGGLGLALAGGSARSSAGIAPRESVSTSIELINGYISGATVWQDDNRNGVLDAGERSAQTDPSGKVTLVVDPDGGPLRSNGGVDISTGEPVTNSFASPADTLVITPLTTLIAAAVESGQPLSQALADARKAFGLSENANLLTLDPVEASFGTGEGAEEALKVKAAAVQVANLMDIGASLLEGAGSTADGAAVVARALAQAVAAATDSGIDLASADQIKAVMVTASQGAGLDASQVSRINAAVDAVAVVAATANTLVASAAQAVDPVEGLSQMARAQRIAQVEASAAVKDAVAPGGSASALTADFGPSGFAQKASALTGGLISPDRPVLQIEVLALPVKPPAGSTIELPTLPPVAVLSLVGNIAVTGITPGAEAKVGIAIANFDGTLSADDLVVSGGLEVVGLEALSPSRYLLTLRATGTTLGAQTVTLREGWAGEGSSTAAKSVGFEVVDRFEMMDFDEASARVLPFEGALASIVELSDGNAVARFTKPTGAQAYAGMTVALNDANGIGVLPVSASNSKLELWVHAPEAGMPIRLQLASTTAGKVNQFLDSSAPLITDDRGFVEAETLTTQAGWQRLEFDFAQPVARWVAVYEDTYPVNLDPTLTYDQVSIFPDFNQAASGDVFYFDGLSMAGKTIPEPVAPPVGFSSISFESGAGAYLLTGFGGASGVLYTDPEDAANEVLRVTKGDAPEAWAGVTISTEAGDRVPPIEFQPGKTQIVADVWSATPGTRVRIKLEDASNDDVSVEVETVTTVAGWETLRFDFSQPVQGTPEIDFDANYDKLSVFFDFDVEGSAGRSYLIDEIRFVDQPSTLPGNPVPAGFELVFADEFNTEGKTSPDFATWTPDLGDGSTRGLAGWGNGEAQYYTQDLDNLYVENGSLHIVAKSNDSATNTQDRVNGDGQVVPFDVGITSARLTTRDWNLEPYGYVEVRAKLPAEKGAWPAIWMLGSDGQWPLSGEIDIMEWSGRYFNDRTVQAALHYEKDHGDTQTKASTTLASTVERFHTYQLWWSPDEIRIGVDGDYDSAYFKYEKQDDWDVSRWPFDGSFYLIMNVAVGGSLGGDGFNEALAQAPYTMEIDYVRVYQGPATPKGPTTAAPVPTAQPADVISIYSDSYDDVVVNDWSPNWGQSGNLVDATAIEGNAIKKVQNLNYQGVQIATMDNGVAVSGVLDVSGKKSLHIDYWLAEAGNFTLKLISKDGEAQAKEAGVLLSGQAGWNSIDIGLTEYAGVDLDKIIQLMFVSGTAKSLYFDNVYFSNALPTGTPLEPTTAAPVPTAQPADVISLFSDAYTDVTVDTWSAGWDQANLSDTTVAGNAVKRYDDLVFAGIEFTSNPIDATAMTHLHLDVWKRDPDSPLKIKLVDFGADGAYAGGDDVEHELSFNTTGTKGIAGNQWVGLDIPLSDFAGLSRREDLAQMIFVGGGAGDTLWVDNVYFYNANPVG